MNCREMESHAIAYMDGKLSRQEAVIVDRHLASCAHCAERVQAFSDVSGLLDSWEVIQPSASFNARLQRQILAEPATVGKWAGSWWQWLSLPFRLTPFAKPALVGALLGMVLFAMVLTRYTPGQSSMRTDTLSSAPIAATVSDGNDELALYQDLPVLENLDLLSNFEVLQELNTTTP